MPHDQMTDFVQQRIRIAQVFTEKKSPSIAGILLHFFPAQPAIISQGELLIGHVERIFQTVLSGDNPPQVDNQDGYTTYTQHNGYVTVFYNGTIEIFRARINRQSSIDPAVDAIEIGELSSFFVQVLDAIHSLYVVIPDLTDPIQLQISFINIKGKTVYFFDDAEDDPTLPLEGSVLQVPAFTLPTTKRYQSIMSCLKDFFAGH